MGPSPEEMQFQTILENVLVEICKSKGISRDDLIDIVTDHDHRIAGGHANEASLLKNRTVCNRYARRYLNRLSWSGKW